jgi:hypothetical protein
VREGRTIKDQRGRRALVYVWFAASVFLGYLIFRSSFLPKAPGVLLTQLEGVDALEVSRYQWSNSPSTVDLRLRSGHRMQMRSYRSKAIAATRVQWAAICIFVAASIPPLGLLLDPSSARDLALDHLTGGLLATLISSGIVILLQARVAQDGCFGVCAFPPVTRVDPRAALWARVSIQCLFWAAMLIGVLTISRWLEFHLGLVLFLGLTTIWGAVFNATWLALGYEQTVPRGLRFLFAPDKLWMAARLLGMTYAGERSCVDALMDKTLPVKDRLLALELIALRPWVKGGRQAVEAMASNPNATDLASRARELMSDEFARREEPWAA